jgi:Domain of unknown function (DUF5658)
MALELNAATGCAKNLFQRSKTEINISFPDLINVGVLTSATDVLSMVNVAAFASHRLKFGLEIFMFNALVIFSFLQLADLGTTVAVLRLGGVEENPLVKILMVFGPVAGLILAKLVTLAIGAGCFLSTKPRALRVANVVFAGIVVWNLSIIARLV